MPRGTFVVPLAQPAGRLARNLLDPDIKMDEAFLKEQDRRRKARLNDQIYDVTAWSLPLMFDVEVVASDRVTAVEAARCRARRGPLPAAPAQVPAGTIGFLMPWGSGAARPPPKRCAKASASSPPTRRSARRPAVHRSAPPSSASPATPEGVGGDAPEDRAEAWRRARADHRDVDRGGDLARQRPDRLAACAARAAGLGRAGVEPLGRLGALHARAALRRQQVTAMRTATLQNYDMKDYDVLVLPSGSYNFSDDALRRLKDWIRNGGTLITLAEATRWASRDQRRSAVDRSAVSRRLAAEGCAGDAGRRIGRAGRRRGRRLRSEAGHHANPSTSRRRSSPNASSRRISPARCCG